MLVRKMSARDARANFSELLGLVYYTKQPVMVEKKGKPFAVLISPEQYGELQREEQADWAALEELGRTNAREDPAEVLRDVTEVVEEVRQERYEREQAAKAPKRRR